MHNNLITSCKIKYVVLLLLSTVLSKRVTLCGRNAPDTQEIVNVLADSGNRLPQTIIRRDMFLLTPVNKDQAISMIYVLVESGTQRPQTIITYDMFF